MCRQGSLRISVYIFCHNILPVHDSFTVIHSAIQFNCYPPHPMWIINLEVLDVSYEQRCQVRSIQILLCNKIMNCLNYKYERTRNRKELDMPTRYYSVKNGLELRNSCIQVFQDFTVTGKIFIRAMKGNL